MKTELTPQELKDSAAAILCLAEGKPVQFQARDEDPSEWRGYMAGLMTAPNLSQYRYRPKPEPKTRPWKDETEVPALPFEVRWKGTRNRTFIAAASDICVWVGGATSGLSYEEAFKELEKLDGTPCGICE